MAYQVIARKYRPQRFADVIGQEHVTQTLANAIQQKRIAHAYLFCGPRGTGKTTVARIFAKCLNCTDGPNVDFDDADPRCIEITEGRSMDVLEIDGASNNGVEQVRELRDTVKYAPASSRYKIFIIDEVHMLSTQAFNALLKTLEEPPEHVKFMFATTDPEKVLPTILSRCQRFDLRRIPVSLITKHLEFIAKEEKVQADPEALHAIARGADGGMRDAESALDQLISFCGNQIAESDVLSMFGLTSRSQVLALADAILRGEPERALRELNSLAQHGKDLGRLLSDLLGHFRNLLLFQVSRGDAELLEVTETEVASLKAQSEMADSEALTRVLEVLTDAEGRLREAASKKIFIEVNLLKALQARNAVSIESVIRRLQQLRGEGPSAGAASKVESATPAPATAAPDPATTPAAPAVPRPVSPAPAAPLPTADKAPAPPKTSPSLQTSVDAVPVSPSPAVLTPPSPAPVPAKPSAPAISASTPPQNGAASAVDLAGLWSGILEAVGRASPFTRGYLVEAHPVSLTKTLLTIGYDPEFADQMDLVNNTRTIAILQTKLQEAGLDGVQIKFIVAERPADWKSIRPEVTLTPSSAPVFSSPGGGATSAPPSASGVDLAASRRDKPATPPTPIKLNIEEFKKDPLIQKALEIFKGQIVEVRA